MIIGIAGAITALLVFFAGVLVSKFYQKKIQINYIVYVYGYLIPYHSKPDKIKLQRNYGSPRLFAVKADVTMETLFSWHNFMISIGNSNNPCFQEIFDW